MTSCTMQKWPYPKEIVADRESATAIKTDEQLFFGSFILTVNTAWSGATKHLAGYGSFRLQDS